MLDIKTVTGGPLDVNTYVVALDGAAECVLIDPGAEYAVVNGAVCGRKVTAVLLTHAHFDHMLYARPWLKEGVKLYVHEKDAAALGNPELNLSGIVGAQLTLPQADVLLKDGDKVKEAGICFVCFIRRDIRPDRSAICMRSRFSAVIRFFIRDTVA